MSAHQERRLHGTTIAIGGRGVVMVGPSGSGKSDLALRLIDRGAALVADDYTELAREGGMLCARAPATIAGKIEVRGVGIVELPAESAPIALIVDLDASPERMPEPSTQVLEGIVIPTVALSPFDASAPIKVELALKRFGLPLEEAPS